MANFSKIYILSLLLLLILCSCARPRTVSQIPNAAAENIREGKITVAAGKKYIKDPVHEVFFGSKYRDTWATPVEVAVFDIDTAKGGLKILQQSGSRQTIGLRLEDSSGQQWVLRSIDKDPAGNLAGFWQKTFVADIINDMTSSSHPYGAFILPPMAAALEIYHTKPELVYVPHDDRLGEYKEILGGTMALLEERADDDESHSPHFGYSENVRSTRRTLMDVLEDNDHRIDARTFLINRYFDMLLGDWSRHEDNWRWATAEKDGIKIYKPIPRDRDNVFFQFDGLLPTLTVKLNIKEHFRTFRSEIDNEVDLNKSGRNLDELILISLNIREWMEAVRYVEDKLTDEIIENAVRELPENIYDLDGEMLTSNLKQRRDQLQNVALGYYMFLNKYPSLVGTDKHERFEVTQYPDSTTVKIYAVKRNGEVKHMMLERTFHDAVTRRIALFGLSGEDNFIIKRHKGSLIKLHINGGAWEDEYDITTAGSKQDIRIWETAEGNQYDIDGKVKKTLKEVPDARTFTAQGWLLRYYLWD